MIASIETSLEAIHALGGCLLTVVAWKRPPLSKRILRQTLKSDILRHFVVLRR